MRYPTDNDARVLVAELAALGGDPDAIQDRLLEVAEGYRGQPGALVTLILTALSVTFGECLPGPATTERTA